MKQLTCIVAHDLDFCIGKNNKMPWPKLSKDLKRFKKITLNHVLIMGRKTFESIPKKLKNRHILVLSRSIKNIKGAEVFSDPDKCLRRAYEIDSNPIVAGGAEIYDIYKKKYTKIYQTVIDARFDGDTYLKPLKDQCGWVCCKKTVVESNGLNISFVDWVKKIPEKSSLDFS